jgi:hypothetical protein
VWEERTKRAPLVSLELQAEQGCLCIRSVRIESFRGSSENKPS